MAKANEWATAEKLAMIEEWARVGLTNKQIAHNMGISDTTFYDWQQKYPAFSDTIKRGKEVADQQVENALFQRAIGYTAIDKVTETTEKGMHTKETQKHIPGDVTAMIFWLKNRKPEQWRDKVQNEISGTMTNQVVTNPYDELTTEQLKTLADAFDKYDDETIEKAFSDAGI